jgi:predicted N-acetyltransferase YhbS
MASPARPVIRFGFARATERRSLCKLLWREKLNFLSPWTCDVEKSMVVARDAEEGSVVGAAKLGPLSRGSHQSHQSHQSYELSSVVVEPAYRGQGIGKELVQRAMAIAPDNAAIFLTTLEDRRDLYAQFGFRETADTEAVPLPLKLEMVLGSILFQAAHLIVMVRRSDQL